MSPFEIDNPVAVSVAAVAALVGYLVYKYPDCAVFDDPRERGIPYIKGIPILGNLPEIIANIDRYYELNLEEYEKLDSLTFRYSQLLMPCTINTADPRNVEHILKTNFENYVKGEYFNQNMGDLMGSGIFNVDGERWKVQRKVASRIFHVKNFRDQFTSVFLDEINLASREIFDKAAENNEIIDFHDIMLRFAMDSFAQLGFSVKINSLLERAEFADSFDALQFNAFERYVIPYHDTIEKIKRLAFWRKEKSIKQHLEIVNKFAYGVIKERREKDQLLHNNKADEKQQEGEEEDNGGDILHRFMTSKNAYGNLLTDEELRDTILNFIIAGRDTTAQALSWTFYNLMKYPDIQAKVNEEVSQYITDEIELNPPELYEAVQKMVYSHAVLFEVLRLYPSVPGNQKEALEDDIWPDGTRILKGDQVSWQPFTQGRLEKIWGSDAKEFKPERWISPTDGTLIRVSPYQWSAFNAGPRVCLGQNLAILEAIIAIALIIKRYKFHRAPGHQVVILNLVTLSMQDGMKITVEKRNK